MISKSREYIKGYSSYIYSKTFVPETFFNSSVELFFLILGF